MYKITNNSFFFKEYFVLKSMLMVSFFDFVESIFLYPMVIFHNNVYKQVLHLHRKIYFFHSFLFHISNKQNDHDNIFYYMLYKLK